MIEIEGIALEKLLNDISAHVRMSDIKREGYKLYARVKHADVKRLKEAVPPGRCLITVKSRRGLPVTYLRLRYRIMLFAGALIAVAIYAFFSCFIWDVTVTGDVSPDMQSRILATAAEIGVKEWMPRGKVNKRRIENELALRIPELAWVALEHEGVRLRIKAREMSPPPQIIDRDAPMNIVASKDAIIYRMIVLQGRPVVKEGDEV
ncbi:MAG TPA: sporulation protein YqfD, partial [Clostridia bacterium]|nr:sporulation protein YqfD [Clostridia bacterium]